MQDLESDSSMKTCCDARPDDTIGHVPPRQEAAVTVGAPDC
jgi:hypothetical protein